MASEMDNAHVAKVSNDNTGKDSPSASSKTRDVKDVKANDDGKEIKSSSNNGGKQADSKDDGGASIVKDETADEKDKKKKKEDKKEADKKNPIKQLNKANAMGSAVGTGYKLIAMAQFFMMMKMMFQGAVAAVSNFFTGILGWLFGVVQAVGGFFGSIGGAIGSAFSTVAGLFSAAASALGVSATAMALAVVTAATGGATVVVGSAVVSANNAVTAQRDENVEEDCAGTGLSKATAVGMTTNVDINAEAIKMASQIYGIMHHYGFTDAQIAGFLGNMEAESGVDPTCVEGIYDEPFQVGPKTQHAIDLGCIIQDYLPGYPYVYEENGVPFPAGIGIAQFTGEENTMLFQYAARFNKKWSDLDVQMAYGMDTKQGGYGHAAWFMGDFLSKKHTSIEEAAYDICVNYEIPADKEEEGVKRGGSDYAGKWYARILQGDQGFNKGDTTAVASVVSMIGAAQAAGANSTAAKARSQCKKLGNCYNNSDIASAAASLALPPGTSGLNNDGSETYQKVHDAIFGADNKKSCDNLSATAVRWSGADNNYPQGATDSQDEHVVGNPEKWEIVKPTSGGVGPNNEFFVSDNYSVDHLPEELQPGDVIMEYDETSHSSGRCHTWVFTGEEALTAVYPENGTNADYHFNAVSASWPDTGPECRHARLGHTYCCLFRCKQFESEPKYKDAGAAFTSSSAGTSSCSAGIKSKILLIGDSRTVLIAGYSFGKSVTGSTGSEEYKGPVNDDDFIYAKSSMGLSWVKQNETDIASHIDGDTAVVMFMGTNDSYSVSAANDYISYMNTKANEWTSKGAAVYFAAVSPVNDSQAAQNGYSLKDSNVVAFNNAVKAGLAQNVSWIDTYSVIKDKVYAGTGTEDGIHYTVETCNMIKDEIWKVEAPKK